MIRLLYALLILSLPASLAAARQPVHRAGHGAVDWTHVAAETADGGIRVGNPKAKVALVEYFSFTCPHCAVFSGEATTPLLEKYVRTGAVSYELRPALRDAVDLAVAMAARCAAPQRYLPATEAIMAAQQDWERKAIDYVGQHEADLNGPNRNHAIHGMLDAIGIGAILAGQGVTSAALDACLADKKAEAAVQQTTNDAWNVKHISGTPGFLIDGAVKADIHAWSALEPAIQAALKG